MLGFDIIGMFVFECENVDEDICVIGMGFFKVEVDLMELVDLQKKFVVYIILLNYIGLWIDDLFIVVEWLIGKGVCFVLGGICKGVVGFDIIFLYFKVNDEFLIVGEGVLIELVQVF